MDNSLIFNDLTCIDYSYISIEGKLIGCSCYPTVILTLNKEGYTLDVSFFKNVIRELLEDKDTGYDHKLWIMKDSKATVYLKSSSFEISTDVLTITTDLSSLKHLNCEYNENKIGLNIAEYLKSGLKSSLGLESDDFSVEVLVDFNFHALNDSICAFPFRYCHGIKDSKYSCQNIAHGHLSYIQVLGDNYIPIISTKLEAYMENLSRYLDNTYFVCKDYITYEDDSRISLEYTTADRGYFAMDIDKTKMRVKVMNAETTIDNILSLIKKDCLSDFKELGVKYLIVSSGLDKGAISKI